ncbi:peptidyl-prolyl cis-trans isomerase [Fulvivirga sedimenti]|uniref:Peptidyl-prolyl cis-trans isomerase n=1 Tax=Fulvivirga sedimenti TaxID=2879465 RepID=A0A9X1HSR0_9BACT|nr:peptidylprolyl isomerase [Fulvivirga sedimenti]MCA6074966.1 peptidyl-prolyl cis-trans isomerase [Fulvivirga sedimenti]MCA6076143.1 peptidyl-prolyl cis-trans isomerase [Fulvivirga sedimenti]MCA6077271.1 peptidyl-prolyl cis-trans isomerase [Fulvivirga sedimenti]
MKQLFSSPIFHILAFGALLAIVLIVTVGPKLPSSKDKQVLIADDDVAHLLVMWQKTWQRPPTREELRGALNGYVQDEILYQEAINRNLDYNNAMVRQALIVQMNMLAETQGSGDKITEESIQAYYALRKDQFVLPARISFAQLYFSPDKHPALESHVNEVLTRISQEEIQDIHELGDPTMLNSEYKDYAANDLLKIFGENFAEEVFTINPGEWTGPIASAYGLHLVKVQEVTAEAPAPIDLVRNEIMREIEYEEKEAAREQFFTELIRQYDIVYEGTAKEVMKDDE